MIITGDDSGDRIDTFLQRQLNGYSRSYLAKMIDEGKVLVDDRLVKNKYRIKPQDKITLNLPVISMKTHSEANLPIIYEDEFCLVVNKPAGMLTHAKGAQSEEASAASIVSNKLSPEMTGNRAGIVHRLDRGTSGVMIVARTQTALKYLQSQFAKRQVHKNYLAIVKGKLEHRQAVINLPIERNPKAPATFRTGPNGKTAVTEYSVLQENGGYSLISLLPRTGRTHQLRVHLKAIGHPIIGDTIYGGEPADRLMLHAYRLDITLPDIGLKSFSAPVPDEFNAYIRYDSSNG